MLMYIEGHSSALRSQILKSRRKQSAAYRASKGITMGPQENQNKKPLTDINTHTYPCQLDGNPARSSLFGVVGRTLALPCLLHDGVEACDPKFTRYNNAVELVVLMDPCRFMSWLAVSHSTEARHENVLPFYVIVFSSRIVSSV